MAELAEKFHMSYSYFAAIFKEYYGQTCKEMILTVRLQKAEDLLQFTDFDLTYISQETGFCDCSHFIKAFKQKYICDSYSSLLWDIEFYQCGCFEVYIAASPQNVSIFQRGRIVARSDDAQHFGIIESLQLETDAEKGDYLTVTGRFLACLLERRIIYPTITANGSYEDIARKVLSRNVISAGIRNIPGLSMGTVNGMCWQGKTRLQVSYDNLMEWLYTICETIG